MKDRVRQITRRNRGRSIRQVTGELTEYLRGWKGYYHLAETPGLLRALDAWIRHRLRQLHLKQWKRKRRVLAELRARGMHEGVARTIAANANSYWRTSSLKLNVALPTRYFDRLGVPRLAP